MNTEQLKLKIIDKILLVDSPELLMAIYNIVNLKINGSNIYKVSEEQRDALLSAENDIKFNRLLTDDEVNSDEDLWLNK